MVAVRAVRPDSPPRQVSRRLNPEPAAPTGLQPGPSCCRLAFFTRRSEAPDPPPRPQTPRRAASGREPRQSADNKAAQGGRAARAARAGAASPINIAPEPGRPRPARSGWPIVQQRSAGRRGRVRSARRFEIPAETPSGLPLSIWGSFAGRTAFQRVGLRGLERESPLLSKRARVARSGSLAHATSPFGMCPLPLMDRDDVDAAPARPRLCLPACRGPAAGPRAALGRRTMTRLLK